MTTLDLLPCPFCGGRAIPRTFRWGEDTAAAYVECTGCAAQTDHFEGHIAPIPDAIAKWNARTTPAEVTRLAAEVDQLSARIEDRDYAC